MATGDYSSYARFDRSMSKVKPTSRKRCSCGCNGRATHVGLGQGAGMMSGCEFYVRRWVRDGSKVFIQK